MRTPDSRNVLCDFAYITLPGYVSSFLTALNCSPEMLRIVILVSTIFYVHLVDVRSPSCTA